MVQSPERYRRHQQTHDIAYLLNMYSGARVWSPFGKFDNILSQLLLFRTKDTDIVICMILRVCENTV